MAIARLPSPLRRGRTEVLTLSPVYNLQDGRPDDLRHLPFNHPRVVARFNQAITWIFSELERAHIQIELFVFGNEFDLFVGVEYTIKAGDLALWMRKWGEIAELYEQAVAYVKSYSPDIRVTTEMTIDTLLGNARDFAFRMNRLSDVIGVSHYLRDSAADSHVPPYEAARFFSELLKVYPKRPIYFLQYGYSSKSAMGSSEEKQRLFIVNAFQAWDKYRDSIPYICFTWLHELHPEMAQDMALQAGAVDEKAMGFFGGIGLLHHNGRHKPAFTVLARQVKLRGW